MMILVGILNCNLCFSRERLWTLLSSKMKTWSGSFSVEHVMRLRFVFFFALISAVGAPGGMISVSPLYRGTFFMIIRYAVAIIAIAASAVMSVAR